MAVQFNGVKVNSGAVPPQGGVVVVPLRVQPQTSADQVIEKVIIKICSQNENKKDSKMFTLRNIPSSVSIDGLKDVIKNQLKDEVCSNFDVGYMQGSNPVCLRTKEEIWRTILKGNNMILV